jgi:hypothetical protein
LTLTGLEDHPRPSPVGAQLRSGLWTLPRLTRAWTALRRRPRGIAAHTRLDAGKRTPAPTSRLENRPTGRPVFHKRPQASLALRSQAV